MNEAARVDSGSTVLMPTASANGVQELFVINLCASMTPMPAVPKNLKGFEKYKLYQVSRQEDGRRRFRLRLGFFTSEADAEWVLNSVRSLYPAAFTGCVTQEDLRYTGDAQPAAPAAKPTVAAAAPTTPVTTAAPPAVTPAPAPSVPSPTVARPATTPTPAAAATSAVRTAPKETVAAPAPAVAPASKPATTVATAPKPEPARPAPALTASTPAATPQASVDARTIGQPFHVGRGIELPEIDLELTDEYEALVAPSKAAMAPAAPQVKQPTAPRTEIPASSTPRAAAPIHSASFVAPPKVVDDYVPILDTTLTIRTLTKTEAEDPNRPKWFAVQLALSEQPINLDTMPKLDIFAAYSLYCVATMEDGAVKHALRLGFFRESVSAEAVMGYLKAFFNQPSINQISTAEYERFADSKPNSQSTELPGAKVVNLQTKRPTTPLKPIAPAAAQSPVKPAAKPVTSAKPRVTPPPPRPQSFLSRLIGRQLD